MMRWRREEMREETGEVDCKFTTRLDTKTKKLCGGTSGSSINNEELTTI
jgi:hypothetical protein